MADVCRDAVVEAVRADLLRRSELGIAKYGTTLSGGNYSHAQYLQHAYEEALDLANYLQGAIQTERARTASLIPAETPPPAIG